MSAISLGNSPTSSKRPSLARARRSWSSISRPRQLTSESLSARSGSRPRSTRPRSVRPRSKAPSRTRHFPNACTYRSLLFLSPLSFSSFSLHFPLVLRSLFRLFIVSEFLSLQPVDQSISFRSPRDLALWPLSLLHSFITDPCYLCFHASPSKRKIVHSTPTRANIGVG